MRLLITVLIGVGALASAAFVVLYAVGSRAWFRSAVGQNLMALAAVLLGLTGLWLAGRAVGPLPTWLWAGGIGALDAVMWWRVAILWRIQRRRG